MRNLKNIKKIFFTQKEINMKNYGFVFDVYNENGVLTANIFNTEAYGYGEAMDKLIDYCFAMLGSNSFTLSVKSLIIGKSESGSSTTKF